MKVKRLEFDPATLYAEIQYSWLNMMPHLTHHCVNISSLFASGKHGSRYKRWLTV